MSLAVFEGDAVEQMRSCIAAGGVQLVLTSPPYDGLRTYGGHSWDFEDTAKEISRVLCDGGICCWNVGDSVVDGSESLTSAKQKIFFREQCGLRVHQTLIYQKRNFSHPDASRYHKVFEYVFIFSKGELRAWNPLIDRKNITAGSVGNLGINTFTEADGSKSVRGKKVTAGLGKRHNVWLGNTRGQEEMCAQLPHPAMMPRWLARDLILSYSNVGDIVLDPFAGSGTTGKVALEFGRSALLIEQNPEYIPIIERETSTTLGLALV